MNGSESYCENKLDGMALIEDRCEGDNECRQ